jgi:hypothetical protein
MQENRGLTTFYSKATLLPLLFSDEGSLAGLTGVLLEHPDTFSKKNNNTHKNTTFFFIIFTVKQAIPEKSCFLIFRITYLPLTLP